MRTPASSVFDTVPWSEFVKDFRWRQGQHAAIIKPTGGGKTTLEGAILSVSPPAPCTVVLVTKVYDKTFPKQFPAEAGWKRVEEWPPPRHYKRVLLWPRYDDCRTIPEIIAKQKRVFTHALDSIFMERGWTVVFDEEHYQCEMLGLYQRITMFHTQGRSSGLTCVDGVQRPVSVPKATFSGAHHAFVGNTTDVDDFKKIKELGTKYKQDIVLVAPELDEFEFLYVPSRLKGREPVRTTVDLSALTKAA